MTLRRSKRLLAAGLIGGVATSLVALAPADAQERWNPFEDQTRPVVRERRSARPSEAPRPGDPDPRGGGFAQDAPAIGGGAEPLPGSFGGSRAVEKTELAPLPPPSGGLPGVAAGTEAVGAPQALTPAEPLAPARQGFAGSDASQVPALTRISKEVELPVRSPALSALLVRVVGPGGVARGEDLQSLGLRASLLYRAGQIEAAAEIARSVGDNGASTSAAAAFTALSTRIALALGDRERVCAGAQVLVQAATDLPASLKGEGVIARGYCGAAAGNPGAAGLSASLGREMGGLSDATLAALDAIAVGDAPVLSATQRVGVTEWRLAEVSGKLDAMTISPDRLEPAALAAAARSSAAPARLRVGMAEAAARIHVIDAAALADAYRQAPFNAADLSQPFSAKVEPWARRALLLKAAEVERTPIKRARVIRAALDDARRAGLFVQVAAALAPIAEEIRAVPEVGWFAETAVEVMFAAGRLDAARRWAEFGSQPGVTADRAASSLVHWLALIDIADPQQRGGRGQSLALAEEVALRGRFSSEGLHRFATVLDALDFQVPVRLWEAASRAPQPTSGYLPPTGVLAELQDSAKRKEAIRTATLIFRTLGVNGPEGAHMIALGDAIRALRRAGFETEARAVAAEALFALWPRASSS